MGHGSLALSGAILVLGKQAQVFEILTVAVLESCPPEAG